MSLEEAKLILGEIDFNRFMSAQIYELHEMANQACLGGAEKELDAIEAIIESRTDKCRDRQ